MRLTFISVLSVLLVATACGEDDPIPTPGFQAEEPRRVPGRSFNPRDDLFDEEGNLREGEEVIVGLTMPRGLDKDEERSRDRRHVYFTNLELEKVVAYFGPRLFTGAVTRIGDGAVYRGARPVNVRENPVLLDVSVLTAGTRTRVEVVELPPVPQNPPSAAELERRWNEMQKRLD